MGGGGGGGGGDFVLLLSVGDITYSMLLIFVVFMLLQLVGERISIYTYMYIFHCSYNEVGY